MIRAIGRYIAALFEDDNGKPKARIVFASICTLCLLYVFITTCIFNMNGKPEHIQMFNTMVMFTGGLFGLSAAKSWGDSYNERKREEKCSHRKKENEA